MRRSAYCRDYPDNCEKVDDVKAFCSLYKHFCEEENITEDDLVFPDFIHYFILDFNRSLVEKYGTRKEDILKPYQNLTTPVIYANEFGKLRNCYSIDLMKFHLDNLSDELHKFYEMSILQGTSIGNLIVTFNPKELFGPLVPIGAKISIYSQDQLVNPFIDGFLIKPGKRYIVQLKAIEENLLASPYSTNCTNYEKEKGKSSTYNNREHCLLECKKENWLKECGCISGEYSFEYDGKFCVNHEEVSCIGKVNVEYCYDKCKASCHSIFFEYDVSEVPLEYTGISEFINADISYNEFYMKKKKVWYSAVNLFFKRPEILIYKYKPQYELIELFSYIGGYIGIWLGISLIAVCDFLEMLFTYCYHLSKGKVPVNREIKSNPLMEAKSDL